MFINVRESRYCGLESLSLLIFKHVWYRDVSQNYD